MRRARITRAHYRDFALFAFTTFTQGDCFIAILRRKKQGDKRKNVGDFLEKVQRFWEKVQRFSENLPRFCRKAREAFSENSFYGSQCIQSPFEIIGNFSDSSDIMR